MTVLVRAFTDRDGQDVQIQIPAGVAHAELAGRPLQNFDLAGDDDCDHDGGSVVGHVLSTVESEDPLIRTDLVVVAGTEPPAFSPHGWTLGVLYSCGHRSA